MNKSQLVAHVAGDPIGRMLAYVADNNPRGLYNAIKRGYGDMFDTWEPGVEDADDSKEQMIVFLQDRANEKPDPTAFTISILQSVRYNAYAGNWTAKPTA